MSISGAYYAHLEAEHCQASKVFESYGDCTGAREVLLSCATEGVGCYVCANCARRWRAIAKGSGNVRKCPRCFRLPETPQPSRPVPQEHPAMTGDVAMAVISAMHAEGILEDVRARVLKRLTAESPWLAAVRAPGKTTAIL